MASVIWGLGSAAFFLLLKRGRESIAARRRHWRAIAALAGGTGVWSTHFVAMLGYSGAMPLTFSPNLTALSVVAAVVGFWCAAALLDTRPPLATAAASGVIATTGVAVMHFTGMSAIESAAKIQYDHPPIVAGTLIACSCLALAFGLFNYLRGLRQIAVPAAMAFVAVVVLHFTAMAATTLVPDVEAMSVAADTTRTWLIGAVVCVSLLLMFATAVASAVDRTMTDLRGLADAALEGLAIVRDGVVIDANPQTARLIGVDARTLLGRSLDRWLRPADGLPVATLRPAPVEAALSTPGVADRVLELAAHRFEYRGQDCQVVALRDLTETRDALRRIEHLARHDMLTGLPNRAHFDQRLTESLACARRSSDALAVLAVDLDRFKAVNDIFGHAAGDKVLVQVAELLRGVVEPQDTVARVGGDEFMILQVGVAQPAGARRLVQRIQDVFAREMDVARNPHAVGISIGVAICPDEAVDATGLRHGADVALYRSKSAGRGTVSFFDRAMDIEVRDRRALEHDLRHALWRKQMSVVYQPLVTASGGTLVGYEALLRWAHPERGTVEPDVFIPIAEETGCILALGEWVLREATAAAAHWPQGLTMAVNVSRVQFQVTDLDDTVGRILAETRCPPHRLELEITESVMMKDPPGTIRTLRKLKARGVRIAMDDFGNGYSSLRVLQSFPFDKIKIDRSFTAAIAENGAARTIVRAIAGIGQSLSTPVVAEGVENEQQRRLMIDEGCAEAQGFLFGRPGPLPVALSPSGGGSTAMAELEPAEVEGGLVAGCC